MSEDLRRDWAAFHDLAAKLLPEVQVIDSMMFGHAFACDGRIHCFFNDRDPHSIGQPLRGTMPMQHTLETIACLLKSITVASEVAENSVWVDVSEEARRAAIEEQP